MLLAARSQEERFIPFLYTISAPLSAWQFSNLMLQRWQSISPLLMTVLRMGQNEQLVETPPGGVALSETNFALK